MKDTIHIRNLEVAAVLGVLEGERTAPRRIIMNISVQCDTRKAGASDRLDEGIDYREIRAAALGVAEGSRFKLVEALAEKVADAILAIEGISAVTVVVDKPGALQDCESVAVDIFRQKA